MSIHRMSLHHLTVGLGLLVIAGMSALSCTDDAYCFTCGAGGATTTTAGTGGSGGAPSCVKDADCTGSMTCCTGVCVDLETNPASCGACDAPCGSPEEATATCSGAKCGLSCVAGYADCDHLFSNGCEVSLATDANNCGACGVACLFPNAAGVCVDGKCGLGACQVGFGNCDNDATNGCEANLASDPANCTACGMACSPPANVVATCTAGTCGGDQCATGYADCNMNLADGCEVDISTDPANCGACAMACGALAHATTGCSNGACSIASCDTGYADCDKSVYDGCEANLATDTNNCSACGMACVAVSEGFPACTAGACGVGVCDAGYADCDLNAANGCEVNLSNDVNNCGACAVACPAVSNGTPVCSGFVCGIGSCNAGFANCFGPPTTCETDLQTDVNHCGMCGTPCPSVANATVSCGGVQCGIAACAPTYADCDLTFADGCEVSLPTDVNNCGTCNNVCPTPPNGVAGCAGSACTLASCNAGFANCDNNAANGCEKSVLTDPMNCGGCGIVCGSGTCTGGVCACIKSVLLIEDDSAAGSATLAAALAKVGYTVTQTAVPSYQYNGTNPALAGFGAVVVLAGGPQATSYQTDMPAAGQAAIVAFLNAGNGVVFTEWAAYEVAAGHWQTLAPFVLLQRTDSYSGQVTYTVDPAFASHPVWNGLPATFTLASTSNVGLTHVAPFVTRIAGSPQAIDAVAIRDAPAGRVVHLAHAGNYQPNGWTNANTQTLVTNAAGWVARCF